MPSRDTNDKRSLGVLVTIFVCVAVGIVAAGYVYYRNYEKQYRSEVERQLWAIADLKVDGLVWWRKERLGDGGVFFKNPSFSALVRRFFEKPADADAKRQLQDWLGKYPVHDSYEQVRLLDAQGVTHLSVPDNSGPASSATVQGASVVLRSGQVAIQDFYRNDHDQHIYLAVLVPILDERDAGRPLGVLVLRIDPEAYLYPFIKRWPTPSRTAETLLVRREGDEVVFLNELRFQSNTALNLRAPLDRVALPAAQAAMGRECIMEGIDYRAVPVVAALRAIPDSSWSLVARMDIAEVYAPLRERLWQIVALIGALLFGAGAGTALVWRQQRIRFYRERAETEKEASRMATVVRDSNDAITIQDFQGRITAWNRGAERMYGYSEEEALVANIDRLTAPGKVAEQKDFIRRLIAGEAITSFETQRVTKDGRVLDVWMTVTKLMDEAGKPVGVASTERDITERKRTENALRESNDYLENLINHANAPIIVWDPQFRITRFNHAFEFLTGRRADEVIGKSLELLFPPASVEGSMALFKKTTGGERWETVEISILHLDGSIRTVLWNSATLFTADGQTPVATIAQGLDITERIQAVAEVHKLNAELEQRVVERTAQLEAANKELEAFSYSVSHDLRAPLRHVQGYVDMLERETGNELSDKGRRYMKTITDVSREMGVLIDDLLAFSRMGRTEMSEANVNLDKLVQETLRDLETTTRGRNIVWKIPPLPGVQADRAILKLALTNLLGNAVKFTRPRDPAQIEIGSAGREGERAIFFVRDNGVGFDPQYAHNLFGVFQRLHRADEFEGTGIGLANVRRIIARHGGRTWAEGRLNEGATFFFTLKGSAVQGFEGSTMNKPDVRVPPLADSSTSSKNIKPA
jgi:PAS domain S-box-containing protein